MRNNPLVFPVGSVVECSGKQFLIIGYEANKLEDRYEMQYVVVPYPAGFCAAEQLKVTSVEQVNLVEKGYDGGATGETATNFVNGLMNVFSAFSAQEIEEELKRVPKVEEAANE